MMEASVDLLELPLIRQLFLRDPQLLVLKLRHVTTLVDKIRIGSTYQRVSRPSQNAFVELAVGVQTPLQQSVQQVGQG